MNPSSYLRSFFSSGIRADEISPTIHRLVTFLDDEFVLPGTDFKFGVDALIGLVPGIGDWIGAAIGSMVLVEAFRLQAPSKLIARMAVNLFIDAWIGSLPLLGDLFDAHFKANRRNLQLLVQLIDERRSRRAASAGAVS